VPALQNSAHVWPKLKVMVVKPCTTREGADKDQARKVRLSLVCCLPVCLSASPSVWGASRQGSSPQGLSVCPLSAVSPSVCLPVCLFTCLSLHLSICLRREQTRTKYARSVYLFSAVCLPVCLPVCLFVCLPVRLSEEGADKD
jgi:hypothetical protein